MMSVDFLLTTLIIVVSPGTGVLFTMATGLSRGSRASVVAASDSSTRSARTEAISGWEIRLAPKARLCVA